MKTKLVWRVEPSTSEAVDEDRYTTGLVLSGGRVLVAVTEHCKGFDRIVECDGADDESIKAAEDRAWDLNSEHESFVDNHEKGGAK